MALHPPAIGAALTAAVLLHAAGATAAEFITWDDLSVPWNMPSLTESPAERAVIVVAADGSGDSRTVQGAINLVPFGNSRRVKILVRPGLYREKVSIPADKPYISIIGTSGADRTVISWHARASDLDLNGQPLGTMASASFAVNADFFCARGISFENTAPRAVPGGKGEQAVALRVSGDRAVVAGCRIMGSQDTLFDHVGRHFYYKSFIQGSIDFIFGDAKSLYKSCTIQSVATTYGAVAASQRSSPSEDTGFSFVDCRITGSGMVYLGRAWGQYSTVVYSRCHMDDIVIPQGWDDWGDPSRTRTVVFGEYGSSGVGGSMARRVLWARSLTMEEASPFMDQSYIAGDQWLRL